MQVLIDKDGLVIGYATVGGFVDGVEVETLPVGFEDDFYPQKWRYLNGELVISKVPKPPEPDPEPIETLEMRLERMEARLNAVANSMDAEQIGRMADSGAAAIEWIAEIETSKQIDLGGDISGGKGSKTG